MERQKIGTHPIEQAQISEEITVRYRMSSQLVSSSQMSSAQLRRGQNRPQILSQRSQRSRSEIVEIKLRDLVQLRNRDQFRDHKEISQEEAQSSQIELEIEELSSSQRQRYIDREIQRWREHRPNERSSGGGWVWGIVTQAQSSAYIPQGLGEGVKEQVHS